MYSKRIILTLHAATFLALGQQPQSGFSSIPNLTPKQSDELTKLSAGFAAQTADVAAARKELLTSIFSKSRSDEAISTAVSKVCRTEIALANFQATALTGVQASPNKLSADQRKTWVAMGGLPATRSGRQAIPNITQRQLSALTKMAADVTPSIQRVAEIRLQMFEMALAGNPIKATQSERTCGDLEFGLAKVRADHFAKIQAGPSKLAPDQITALIEQGGAIRTGGGMAFTHPEPMDFNDHDGYIPLFDGSTLKGWDGNPKFWRAEGGSIVGESTPQNPSGNSYLVYRDVEAKDFTLKFEIKIEGTGGSGLQYRSKTGIPWLAPIAPNVTANTGPVNLNWMMTGPQADFWPSSRDWTGQFYSENTPMRILAWRGQVVEGAGFGTKRLMGTVGDRQALGALTKMNDWNQFTVIARGGTFIHILNGHLMAVMIDDDPNSSNNQSGLFGIEIEATTKVSVRNIWLKKIN